MGEVRPRVREVYLVGCADAGGCDRGDGILQLTNVLLSEVHVVDVLVLVLPQIAANPGRGPSMMVRGSTAPCFEVALQQM